MGTMLKAWGKQDRFSSLENRVLFLFSVGMCEFMHGGWLDPGQTDSEPSGS